MICCLFWGGELRETVESLSLSALLTVFYVDQVVMNDFSAVVTNFQGNSVVAESLQEEEEHVTLFLSLPLLFTHLPICHFVISLMLQACGVFTFTWPSPCHSVPRSDTASSERTRWTWCRSLSHHSYFPQHFLPWGISVFVLHLPLEPTLI